ncbi:flagellar hook-basal body complex protein FliE [Peribacillus deserti]|uniref:Flagellar hook-basal body complex protein FliE n=1 Tax=Peribacillus deserti TaxID=673318 RepID=A0A2N5MB05_9BACI|nr:flagellar hook-basal body complex protein FliE [Peribacillus deserti]PLT31542.1 flagellar hook-basal body complex protein FliE [Peribacillus deserti]
MINGITLAPLQQTAKPENLQTPAAATPYEAQKSFASVLKESIEKVNESQVLSDQYTSKLARGENVDLHQVMIASQKASITLEAAMEVRNKVIETYQEMMRIQV